MRFPWIQVEQDALERIPALAAWLGVDEDACEGKLARAWRWGTTLGTEDAPPDGVCRATNAKRRLAAEMRYLGDPETLAEAMEATGFLELLPDGIRIRGMKRYRPVWEKNQRRKPSKTTDRTETDTEPAKTGPVPERSAAVPERQTQTQTHIETKNEVLPRARVRSASPPKDIDFDEVAAGANSDGRIFEDDESLTLGWFFGWVQGFREHKGMIAEHPCAGLSEFWAEVERSGCANGRIQRAFAEWMHGDWGPRQKPLVAFIPPTVWRQRIGPKSKPVVHEVRL